MAIKQPRVTIFGKLVRKIETRAGKHFAVFNDATELAITAEAAQRISERLQAGSSDKTIHQASIADNSSEN
jgi:hypothetical protein